MLGIMNLCLSLSPFHFIFGLLNTFLLFPPKNARTGGQQVVDKTLLRCLHVAQHVLL